MIILTGVEIIAAVAVAASIAGTAATIATLPDPVKPEEIFVPPAQDVAEARRQQKARAAARLGAQKTIVSDATAAPATVGSPTLLGG